MECYCAIEWQEGFDMAILLTSLASLLGRRSWIANRTVMRGSHWELLPANPSGDGPESACNEGFV
jgi:hypothetical protein